MCSLTVYREEDVENGILHTLPEIEWDFKSVSVFRFTELA